MTSFIKIPFAQSGDKTTVPDTDPAGGVNMAQGYPVAYSKDPATDPAAKRIERELFNGLINKISTAINEIQTSGVAPFIAAADNGDTAFAYGVGAIVKYNGIVYQSLIAANTDLPTVIASWSPLLNNATGGGRLANTRVFTSSVAYTPPTNFKRLRVRVQAPGASGSGSPATGATDNSFSSGGGAGSYVEAIIFPSDITGSVNITIGLPGTSGTGAGNNGGTTSFGTLITCPGGSAAPIGSVVSSSATSLIPGAPESNSPTTTLGVDSYVVFIMRGRPSTPGFKGGSGLLGGIGAHSIMGSASGAKGSDTVPNQPTGYGAGGTGSCVGTSKPAVAGSTGGNGVVIVEEYL